MNNKCNCADNHTPIKEAQCVNCGGFKKISLERKIVEYTIQTHSDIVKLVQEVNRMIAEDWQLFGPPFSDGSFNAEVRDECCIHQAMVKYEES